MSKKLLLADDSITIQKVIQITFAHEDYELTITDNGDSALAMAQEIRPDLVMSDVYMPGKNGYELTSAIKQDPALQHVPVLLLAGSFEPFDEDKARSCKADAWIEKPFESQNLIDKVAELLSSAVAAPIAPVPEPEPVFEEPPVAFEEPAAAVPEDPFGDISFEEEIPAMEPEPVSLADDWSDVALETKVDEPVAEDTFAVEEPAVDDFSFAEEEPVPVADFAPVTEAPVAEADFDAFDMDDDDIMALDDDDILGEEDLEPVMPEQTLAAWSRSEAAEDVFAGSLEDVGAAEEAVFAVEEPVAQASPAFDEPAADVSTAFEEMVFEDEPAVEVTPAFEEPAAEMAPAFEEPAEDVAPAFVEPAAEPAPVAEVADVAFEEPVPAASATAAAADVEAKAAAMSEEDIEQVIEKVVTKVVEKLAGAILERVAWEVVPDLAENMIRDEIRKIKDNAA